MVRIADETTESVSVSERIKRDIKGRVDSQELAEGAVIASENELSEKFGVSRNLARQALRELELEGYLIRSRGRRSVVAPVSHRIRGVPLDGSMTVAIALQEQHNLHAGTVLEGFVSRLAEERFQSITYNLQFDPEGEVRFVEHIAATNVAGACLWLQYDQERTRELLKRYSECAFPVVLIDRQLPGVDVDFVVSDNEYLGYALTKVLIEHGHKCIGFATDGDNVASGRDRFEGYRRALAEGRLTYDQTTCGVFSSEPAECESSARAIMAEREAPTAFCCIHDTTAERLVRELARLGYSVPEHVEIAAVDDERIPDSSGIPMITIRQPAYEMGRQAARLLLARIREPRRAPEQIFLKESGAISETVAA